MFGHFQNNAWKGYCFIKVHESRYEQCGVTPHFSTGQNLLKKILRKDNIDIVNWKKFLIDPLTMNNAKYRES